MVEETMYGYTAYFLDDDPRYVFSDLSPMLKKMFREAVATYNNSGTMVQIGFPLKEAVYRTNHGYDPKIRANYEWGQSPTTWSMRRFRNDLVIFC
jgi:hypothetical protein